MYRPTSSGGSSTRRARWRTPWTITSRVRTTRSACTRACSRREAQTDPRVQFNPNPRTGHDARTILYTPYQPLAYSDYTGTLQTDAVRPVVFNPDTDIRLGSYLDAMHNYYEAAGPTGTGPEGSTLDFVNSRRAVGNQAPVNL